MPRFPTDIKAFAGASVAALILAFTIRAGAQTIPATQPATDPTSRSSLALPSPSELSLTQPTTGPDAIGEPTSSDRLREVEVTADLDRSPEQIAPALGAVTYN